MATRAAGLDAAQGGGEERIKAYKKYGEGSTAANNAARRQDRSPRVAIVCDWLTNTGGAEKTVFALHKAFPDAPIFTSVYEPENMRDFKGVDVRTTWLQRFPKFLRQRHQLFPVLRAHAFRNLDLSDYDIIISAASAEAKAVRKRPDAVHICYCHTPTRYYWSHYQEYKKQPGFGPLNPLIRLILPLFVGWMRRLDLRSVRGVDHFIANSREVQARIKKYYNREATVINPPVEMQLFRTLNIKGARSGFVMVGRQVNYKRFDLAVAACTQLGVTLRISGVGPEHSKLVAMAGPTVEFVHVTDEEKGNFLASAQGYIFPQFEDFGIVQVEAMAAGTPVIAYKKGGALDAVVDGKTGVFFDAQTVSSLKKAITNFQAKQFKPAVIQQHAEQFSEERFIQTVRDFVKNTRK